MKVIMDSNLQLGFRSMPQASQKEVEMVLLEAGCTEIITNYFTYQNPFAQTVVVVKKMPRPMLVYGISWKEIK